MTSKSKAAQKTVLITGCSRGGIGDALSQEFFLRGLRVFPTARDVSKAAHLKELGMEVLQLDVTDTASIARCVKEIEGLTGGTLDYLVNNAGIVYCCTVLDMDFDLARKNFDVNFFGVIAVVQAFSPLLIRAKGKIINIGSMSAIIDGGFTIAYSGSKRALEAVSHSLRVELAPFDVKVIHVTTGVVQSNIQDSHPDIALIPDNSVHFPIKAKAEALIMAAKRMYNTPTRVYACKVVDNALNANPNTWQYAGYTVTSIWFVSVIARMGWNTIWDYLTWSMSGLADLKKIVAAKAKKEHAS